MKMVDFLLSLGHSIKTVFVELVRRSSCGLYLSRKYSPYYDSGVLKIFYNYNFYNFYVNGMISKSTRSHMVELLGD